MSCCTLPNSLFYLWSGRVEFCFHRPLKYWTDQFTGRRNICLFVLFLLLFSIFSLFLFCFLFVCCCFVLFCLFCFVLFCFVFVFVFVFVFFLCFVLICFYLSIIMDIPVQTTKHYVFHWKFYIKFTCSRCLISTVLRIRLLVNNHVYY